MNNWFLRFFNFSNTIFSMSNLSAKRSSSSTKSGEKFTFFWKKESPFSQHHQCRFTINGYSYNCAEQYMMHQKALTFNDKEMAQKIMTTDKPQVQKSFGRKVKNFDAARWTLECKDIVKRANLAKFRQNAALKKALFATAGTTMVEASPRDRRWGIGLSAANIKALDRRTWHGTNWLGEILTGVREQLLVEDSLDSFLDSFEGDMGEGCSLSTPATVAAIEVASPKVIDENLSTTAVVPGTESLRLSTTASVTSDEAPTRNVDSSKEVHNRKRKELTKDTCTSSHKSHTIQETKSISTPPLIDRIEGSPQKRKAMRGLEKNVKKRPL